MVVCGRVASQNMGGGLRRQRGAVHIILLHAMAGWHSLMELAANNNGFAKSWKHSVPKIELFEYF